MVTMKWSIYSQVPEMGVAFHLLKLLLREPHRNSKETISNEHSLGSSGKG